MIRPTGIWRAAGASLAAIASAATAATAEPSRHDMFHGTYQNWKTKDGQSCCNKRDCRPAKLRVTRSGVQVFAENRWVHVPKDKIRPYVSPDGRGHACIIPPIKLAGRTLVPLEKRVLCVVGPWGS